MKVRLDYGTEGLVVDLPDEGTTIILVEPHAEIALVLTEHVVVLERGSIVHRGRSRELLRDAALLDRFIGLKLNEAADRAQA